MRDIERNIELADRESIAMFKRMSGTRRREVASGMFAHARRMIAAQVRRANPDWPAAAVDREVARRLQHGTQ